MIKKDFIGSILATKTSFNPDTYVRVDNNHHMGIAVKASSEDEARGMMLRIADKLYPPHKGWHRHHVVAQELIFVTPENVQFKPQ